MRQAVRYVLYALLWGLVLGMGVVAKVWLWVRGLLAEGRAGSERTG